MIAGIDRRTPSHVETPIAPAQARKCRRDRSRTSSGAALCSTFVGTGRRVSLVISSLRIAHSSSSSSLDFVIQF
jgi:hypothetical protein